MLADDVFRKGLNTTVEALKGWAAALRDTGQIEAREGQGYFSVIARPSTPGTCPVTLVLRGDQKFDLSLADQLFEDRPLEDFKLFPALLSAVADGRVEFKRLRCALTGAQRGLETRVELSDGKVWSEWRGGAQAATGEGLIEDTTRFLPYRR